jgi:hypothetical protein
MPKKNRANGLRAAIKTHGTLCIKERGKGLASEEKIKM